MSRPNPIVPFLCMAALCCPGAVHAQRAPFESVFMPDSGKLPLTAGFNEVDGAGGGGLVPWALITGYGTEDSWGANAHYTAVILRDFRLQSYGIAVGVLDRAEASITTDKRGATGPPLHGLRVEQHIYGMKVRLTGDGVYAQHNGLRQAEVGFDYKRNTGISNTAGL